MKKLLIVADDFTGALDTGAQFASCGAATCVVTNTDCDYADMSRRFQVLVVDSESRHLPPRDAYEKVYQTVRGGVDAGFDCIYKKTDSGLRGNIGAELTAVLDGAEGDSIAFLPAFPLMDRVTKNGVHYISGVPVAESVFGRDPFEPVEESSVADIIRKQTNVPVTVHAVGEDVTGEEKGVHVYDAVTDGDLRAAAKMLQWAGKLRLVAGCAGMASVLPEFLGLDSAAASVHNQGRKLLTVCGSVNAITRRQMDIAERAGALRITLTPAQKLDPDWADSAEGRETVRQWMEQIRQVPNAIVECGPNDQATADEVARRGMTLEQTREQISTTMGCVLRNLLDCGLERDLLVTGGDTLFAFMRHVGQDALTPLGEVQSGVVLSRIRYGEKSYNLMSKSGGFGAGTLLADLVGVPD